MEKYYEIEVASTGEIRVGSLLWPEEQRHGMVLRGFTPSEARDMAAQLWKAAEQADRMEINQ